MASQQQRRENTTSEREIHVEKDSVPKRATHFEELGKGNDTATNGKESTVVAVSVTDSSQGVDKQRDLFESVHDKMGGLDIGNADNDRRRSGSSVQSERKQAKEATDVDSKTRYTQAKEETANAAYETIESAKHGIMATASKGCEGIGATTQYISEKIAPVKETATKKAQQVKETLSTASEHAGERSMQATEATLTTAKAVAEYVEEKAVLAKDVAVGTGKTAVGYEEKVAEGVKDQAVVAGWGVAHKTTEIAVEATKIAGGVVGKAKDVVASATHKAAELVEVPVVMATDTAVNAGEKLVDYTARKKTEAEKYREAKHRLQSEERADPKAGEIGQKNDETMQIIKGKETEAMDQSEENITDGMTNECEQGVLEAIGETIVEIAQHATQLVTGPGTGPGPGPLQGQVREKL